MSKAGAGSRSEVVVGARDRARARPRQVGGVRENFQEHVDGDGQRQNEETIETMKGGERGVGLVAGESTRCREKVRVYTASEV